MGSLGRVTVWVLLMTFVSSLVLVNNVISEEAKPGDKFLEKFQTEPKPLESLIPVDVTVHGQFKHGEGDAAGIVEATQGDVYVIHLEQKDAYRITRNQPLYIGDTIVTLEKSSINVVMNDKSAFALAANSKFKIDKADYNADTNKRQSLVQVLWGRARIIVENLGSSNDDYIIKTPTATCGVRGSDIGIFVGPETQEGKTTWWNRTLKHLNLVQDAHAVTPAAPVSFIVAGPSTTIEVVGAVGQAQLLTEFTVVIAGQSVAVTLPYACSVATVAATLSAIAPTLAALDMPPQFE